MAKPTQEQLSNRFFYHPPKDAEQVNKHTAVSTSTYELACSLAALCPEGRQLSLALTALEDVRMRANAAIAGAD